MSFFRGILIALPPCMALWAIVLLGAYLDWASSLIVLGASLIVSWFIAEMSAPVDRLGDDWVASHKRLLERNASRQRWGGKQ